MKDFENTFKEVDAFAKEDGETLVIKRNVFSNG